MRRLGAFIFCIVLWTVCLLIVILTAIDFFRVIVPLFDSLKALTEASAELKWAVWKVILLFFLQIAFYILTAIGLTAVIVRTGRLSKRARAQEDFSMPGVTVGEENTIVRGSELNERSYRYDDGSIYIGSLRNGVHHGHGRYYFPDGACYNGEFVNGKFEGYGTLYDPHDQIIQQGMWHDNCFIGQQA